MVLGLSASATVADVEASISNIFNLFESNAIVNRAILDLLHAIIIKHPQFLFNGAINQNQIAQIFLKLKDTPREVVAAAKIIESKCLVWSF